MRNVKVFRKMAARRDDWEGLAEFMIVTREKRFSWVMFDEMNAC